MLFGKKARPVSTVAEIETNLTQAKARLTHASSHLADLTAARSDILLDGDDTELETHDDRIRVASRDAERCEALVARLEADLVAATASAEQSRRESLYAAAEAASNNAIERATKDYPKAVEAIRTVIRLFAEADLAVAAANESLPEGRQRLPAPEATLRAPLRRSEEILTRERKALWADAISLEPFPPEIQGRVRALKPGSDEGQVELGDSSVLRLRRDAVLLDFEVAHTLPADPFAGFFSLAEAVRLPHLLNGASMDSAWCADAGVEPARILDLLAATKAAPPPSALAERDTRVSYRRVVLSAALDDVEPMPPADSVAA